MVLVPSEMYQVFAVERECWHAVFNGFFCARRGLADGLADLLQDDLHVGREARDIPVDSPAACSAFMIAFSLTKFLPTV